MVEILKSLWNSTEISIFCWTQIEIAIDANNKTREAAAEMDDTKVVIAATQQQQQPPPFLPGGRWIIIICVK